MCSTVQNKPAQLKTRGSGLVQPDPLVQMLGTGFGDEPGRFEHRSAGSVRWTSGRRVAVALVGSMHERAAPSADVLGQAANHDGPFARTVAHENIPAVGRR